MRSFSPKNQKSLKNVMKFRVIEGKEGEPGEEKKGRDKEVIGKGKKSVC